MADVQTVPRRAGEGRYYNTTDRAHDDVLRCHECKALVAHRDLTRLGKTPCCGTRRVTEVTALSLWEYLRIRLTLIPMRDRDAFLAEFSVPFFEKFARG